MTREGAIKWAKEIKAFQEGKDIESAGADLQWSDNKGPLFNSDYNYRIKPAKKIDVATDKISNMMCVEYSDKDVKEHVKESIEAILKDVYGDN